MLGNERSEDKRSLDSRSIEARSGLSWPTFSENRRRRFVRGEANVAIQSDGRPISSAVLRSQSLLASSGSREAREDAIGFWR